MPQRLVAVRYLASFDSTGGAARRQSSLEPLRGAPYFPSIIFFAISANSPGS